MSKTIRWRYKGHAYASVVLDRACPMCGARAVVELPPAVRAEQPDDTTHVCHTSAGGCNHGFALEMVSRVELHPPTCECGLCEVPNDGTPDSSEPRTHLDP